MHQENPDYNQEESIDIKSIINRARYFIVLLFSKWKLIFLGTFCTIVVVVLYTILREVKYSAKSDFVLEQSSSSMDLLKMIAPTLTQSPFLLDEGKTVEILSSRIIISEALLKSAVVNQKNDLLANHLIDIYEFRENWDGIDDYPTLDKVIFTTLSQDKINLEKNFAMNILYEFVTKKLISIENSSEDIISISVKSISEDFSKNFCSAVIESFKEFYIEKTIEKDNDIVFKLEIKLDSIKKELLNNEEKLARWKDESLRLIKVQGHLEEIRLSRDNQILTLIYGEIVKNLETSKMNLMMKKPTLQVINSPVLPLEDNKINLIIALIIGGFLGGFISCGFVIGKDIFITLKKYITT